MRGGGVGGRNAGWGKWGLCVCLQMSYKASTSPITLRDSVGLMNGGGGQSSDPVHSNSHLCF